MDAWSVIARRTVFDVHKGLTVWPMNIPNVEVLFIIPDTV